MLFLVGKEFVREEFKTLQQGCATALVAALDPSIAGRKSLYLTFARSLPADRIILLESSGSYLVDGDIAKEQPSPSVTDPVIAKKLWELSEKLVGENFSIPL